MIYCETIHAAVLLFAAFSCACAGSRESREIRAVLEAVRAAVEAKDFEAAVAPVTLEYTDNLGQRRADVIPRLTRTFRAFERLEVRLNIVKIERSGLTADVLTKVTVTGIEGDEKTRIFGWPLQSRNLQIAMQKRGEVWKIAGSTVLGRHAGR